MDYNQLAHKLHENYRGKIAISLRDEGEMDRNKLSAYYTPGVGAVSSTIAKNPNDLAKYTWTNNLVAVISDGSAVLGLGNIGPRASMPVMEGKALLFKHFANIDAIPIILDAHEVDEIIETVRAISPSFGAINLEDIAAPKCFEIEEKLKKQLDIPVFHDDQHGTAIVVLAGLINSLKVTGRDLDMTRIVIAGAGAAGVAIAKLIAKYAETINESPDIIVADSKGVVCKKRADLSEHKKELLEFTNHNNFSGKISAVLENADVFIGVSGPNTLSSNQVESMATDPIIFALSNPIPEIMPDIAKSAGAAIVATGRSDFPNQINNALAFPGVFRGALDNNIKRITDEHKILAAKTIAKLVDAPSPDEIIPSVFDKRLVEFIAKVIK